MFDIFITLILSLVVVTVLTAGAGLALDSPHNSANQRLLVLVAVSLMGALYTARTVLYLTAGHTDAALAFTFAAFAALSPLAIRATTVFVQHTSRGSTDQSNRSEQLHPSIQSPPPGF